MIRFPKGFPEIGKLSLAERLMRCLRSKLDLGCKP